MISEIEFILYVQNQMVSAEFYSFVLNKTAKLDVPGMTEFELSNKVKLGLMPENGIAKLLSLLPHPKLANGIPRCELYLKVSDPNQFIERGTKMGAKMISPLQKRDWRDEVGYIADLDGHVIAFAKQTLTFS